MTKSRKYTIKKEDEDYVYVENDLRIFFSIIQCVDNQVQLIRKSKKIAIFEFKNKTCAEAHLQKIYAEVMKASK